MRGHRVRVRRRGRMAAAPRDQRRLRSRDRRVEARASPRSDTEHRRGTVPMKKKITHDEYLKLLGLQAIAEERDRELDLVHHSAAKLLEMDRDDPHLDNFYGTHVYDALH